MEKILILGAGISQVPLIRKAKAMGLYVIVASRKGNYPGLALADRAYDADTTDADRIAAVASLEQVQGICTTGTDVAVKSIGKTVDTLAIPGVSGQAAALCTDKLLMKRRFMDHGIRTAEYYEVRSREEAVQAFQSLRAPVIFKAVDGGASKGIIRVDTPEQIDYAFDEVSRWTRLPYFIVEQFIEGEEFGAQAFVYNGEVQFVMPHGDKLFIGDAGVPIGHHVPFELPEAVKRQVEELTRKCAAALEMNDCAVNADFILKDGRVYVLEIGARAGATCLPELVSTFYGFDYYEQMLKVALGQEPDFRSAAQQACVCELLLTETGGRIVNMDIRYKDDPDVSDVSFDFKVGDTVRAFRNGTDRIGQIIVKGSSLEQAMETLEKVKQGIVLELDPSCES